MSDTPTFSIIIPTFRAEPKLLRTLNSLLTQDRRLFEVLLIDGNSPDGTVKIAEIIRKNNPDFAIRILSEPDNGIYDAMNKGTSLARGKYVYYLGAGDAVRPDALSAIASALKNAPCDLLYGSVKVGDRTYTGELSPLQLCLTNLPHQAAFYRRELVQQLGGYDLRCRVFADWELNLRACGARCRMKYTPLIVADYEGGGFSETTKDPFFDTNKDRIIRRHFGFPFFVAYRFRRWVRGTRAKMRASDQCASLPI